MSTPLYLPDDPKGLELQLQISMAGRYCKLMHIPQKKLLYIFGLYPGLETSMLRYIRVTQPCSAAGSVVQSQGLRIQTACLILYKLGPLCPFTREIVVQSYKVWQRP